MTQLSAALRLSLLNEYRAAEGKPPLADWRAPRHQPMLDAYVAAEQAKKLAEQPKVKQPTYKEFARYDRSSVLNPVKAIHDFLDANPDLGRKESTKRLIEMGVNYSTARTQYQRWFSKRKG